ncbi:hypothetical protein NLI96_g6611 [Meripilus lineatus]|uniref:Secreted protein n=1 Tax=Meripilus lineatus TaxID=2056292 RepID=A0AAD5YCT3_9APHY|nr:hypothetical protein NLI96_g6611 [Physisporinus lineatus]
MLSRCCFVVLLSSCCQVRGVRLGRSQEAMYDRKQFKSGVRYWRSFRFPTSSAPYPHFYPHTLLVITFYPTLVYDDGLYGSHPPSAILLFALPPHSSNPKKASSTGHGPNVAAAQVLFSTRCTVDHWKLSTLSPLQVGGATLIMDSSTSATQVRSELNMSFVAGYLSTHSPLGGFGLEVVDWR